jgi:hypothetical protein
LCLDLLLIAGIETVDAAPPGFLEGHLKIVVGMAVEPADEMGRQSATAAERFDPRAREWVEPARQTTALEAVS